MAGAIDTATITQGVLGFAATRACQPLPAAILDFTPIRAFDLGADELLAAWQRLNAGEARKLRVIISWNEPTYQRELPAGAYAAFWNPGNHLEVITFQLQPSQQIVVYLPGRPSGVDSRFHLAIGGYDVPGNYRKFVIDDGVATAY